jgi:hypothetical protein
MEAASPAPQEMPPVCPYCSATLARSEDFNRYHGFGTLGTDKQLVSIACGKCNALLALLPRAPRA